MSKTNKQKPKGHGDGGEDRWNDGDYVLPPQGDFYVSPTDQQTPDLSGALLELDPTNNPVEPPQDLEPVPANEAEATGVEAGVVSKEKVAETLTARVELIKSVDLAYSRLKEIEADATQKTQAHKNRINKLHWDLKKISEGLEESKGSSMEEMAQRIEKLNSRIEKINNRILQIKNEIKTMVDGLVKEEKEEQNKDPEIQPKPANETAEVKDILQISDKKITKIIEYLENMAKDGHTDSDYEKWANILRAQLPETENESERVKAIRGLFDKKMFADNYDKILEHLKLSYDQKQADTMIRLKSGEEKSKWEKRKAMLDEIFGEHKKEVLSSKKIKSTLEPAEPVAEEPKPVEDNAAEADKTAQLSDVDQAIEGVISEEAKWQASRESKSESAKSETTRDHVDKINDYFLQLNEALSEDDIKKAKNKYIMIARELERQVRELSPDELKQFNDKLEKYKIIFEESPKEKTADTPSSDMFEEALGDIEATHELNERIQQLSVKLTEARNKLKEAFVKKEKASGVVGGFKKHILRSKESEIANQEYDEAWTEYAGLQKEMIEASQAQANELRQFLQSESNDLQAKIAEYYKGKENIISKVWRRLGEMNLGNYLEKKAEAVKAMEEQGEEIGRWNKFWANRAKATEQNKLYKIGAKVLSVRLGISMGLLGCGIFGIPGAAIARGAFVGLGSAMGSRHLEDAAQNKIQRWLGNRGEFYSSSEEAQIVMAEKYGIVEKTMDEDADPNEPEDKKTARRRAKFEKLLGKAEKDLVAFESLPVDKRIEKIQEKISAIEAYAYVNGLDLSKDASYQQLVMARETNMEQFLAEKAIEAGDERPVVRPDSLEDAMAFLESRKKELAKTAEKVAGEKELRWIKRGVSAIIGVASGTYAYFATLSRAEIFGGKGEVTQEFVHESAETPAQPSADIEQPELAEIEAPDQVDLAQYAMVRKGEGLERVLQRQLFANPEKFGFQGDLNNADEIKKWVGREAHLIARNQGVVDKYFIYDENKPKYIFLNEDKTINVVGRLHHVSEIVKAKAAEAVRLAQESAIEGAVEQTREGVTDVREVIDLMTGKPKILTNAEQIEFNRLFDSGNVEEAMDYLINQKARGPIFETTDGLQVHRADIGGWEGNAPDVVLPSGSKIEFLNNSSVAEWKPSSGSTIDMDEYLAGRSIPKELAGTIGEGKTEQFLHHAQMDRINDYSQALDQVYPGSDEHTAIVNKLKREFELFSQKTGQDPSKYFDKDFVNRIRSEGAVSVASNSEVPVGGVSETSIPDNQTQTQAFESASLNLVETKYGQIKFEYDNGQPANVIIPDNIPRNLQNSLDRVLTQPEISSEISVSASGMIEAIDVYDNIYIDMQKQGLQNTAEADYVKDIVQRLAKITSENLSKPPEELYNEAIVNRYNLKD